MAEPSSQKPRKCGSCAYCITEEGDPYYCAMQDLYTFVKVSDDACRDYIPIKKGE